jgi:hypothetical protein
MLSRHNRRESYLRHPSSRQFLIGPWLRRRCLLPLVPTRMISMEWLASGCWVDGPATSMANWPDSPGLEAQPAHRLPDLEFPLHLQGAWKPVLQTPAPRQAQDQRPLRRAADV